ncbi:MULTISPECIES: DUF6153 family protein [unclassified Streptomyces]|uniref:DUF6153 family protein n=1 Tax=unclassified Streptomyces TaxID=2593676 RepID=UPI0036FA50F1
MTRSTRYGSRPAGRLFVLLVLAVLAGVLGMHGLAPGGAPAAHADAGHARVAAAADGVPHLTGGCAHPDGGSGHLDHADGTCAAAGTGSSYVPPAPADTAPDALASPAPATASAGAASRAGRAPPDLAELQLLRI